MTKDGHEDSAAYDRLGIGYQYVRRPDPHLGRMIEDALGDAETILNVGAGTGSYEPADRQIVAIDPSAVMLAQHAGSRRVRGEAESLPFPDVSFDAAMAILTVHHWRDLLRGLREVKRVARRQVIFTWDPDHDRRLWIATEYVPAIIAMEVARFATVPRIVEACTDLRSHTISPTASKRRFGGNQRRTLIHESEQPARRLRRCRQNSLSLESLGFVATSNQACGPASTTICWGWTAWTTATDS
jgi:ubiquinone/menaquinone biosynthesis C-methylase UbiE